MASKTELMLAVYELYSHLRKANLNYEFLHQQYEKVPSEALQLQMTQLSEEISLLKKNIDVVSKL